MKDGVVVLNFARDLLVDDDAMAEALLSGKVRKYVTDFPNTKSVKMKGCIAIPHLGASTEEAEDNCAVMAVEELMDYHGQRKHQKFRELSRPATWVSARRPAESRSCTGTFPNMIGQITGTVARSGINISDHDEQEPRQICLHASGPGVAQADEAPAWKRSERLTAS
jgi:D-3-phosphoglycerate dehydrogenase